MQALLLLRRHSVGTNTARHACHMVRVVSCRVETWRDVTQQVEFGLKHVVSVSGADSMGHGGTCPHFYKWLGTEGALSRTVNKKLTKLYWPSRKRSPKRLIVLLEPKKWRGTTKKISVHPTFALDRAPPTFKFVPAPLGLSIYYTLFVTAKFCSYMCPKRPICSSAVAKCVITTLINYADAWISIPIRPHRIISVFQV